MSSGTPADLGGFLDAHVTAAMWGFQDTPSKITEVNITPLDGTSVTYPFVPTPAAKWAGAHGSDDIVPQMSNLIKLVTNKRGRAYRGRLYLPWVCETLQSNGSLDATTVGTVTSAWVAFLAAMASSGPQMVVASYKNATADNVVALICEKYAATQRRRLFRNSQ
jgi:hypothetical protein